MKVLVTGSRTWENRVLIFARVRDLPEETIILHGAAKGADRIAHRAARRYGFEVISMPAQWHIYGKDAGFKRNLEMLDLGPDLVLAFQVGRSPGTQHTIDNASRRGIPVEIYRAPSRFP